MPLKLRPSRERIENRISDLRDSAEGARINVAINAGLVALQGASVAVCVHMDQLLPAAFGAAFTAYFAGSGANEALKAMDYSRRAATLEGVLAQHELASEPYQYDVTDFSVEDQ